MDSTRRASPRLLLIDDQADQLEMYRFALEEAGFAVDEAATGAAALALLRREAPDVIVLDLRLPDMSGWEICRALKSSEATARIPIVILTAAASAHLQQQADDAGCAAVLVKPCYPDDLADTLRRVLAAA